ncbi:MAG: DNA polymerase/3'-5' exonuclease PolX [Candidatus Thermoplasmatota archaeon]|nr:DNA polymerase/3'-5' exonuclease PolX [Candidatus Thermoplasmatota archaeon]
MDNSEVAAVFHEIADLLEIQGVSFRPQAYRRAAQNIGQMDDPLLDVMKDGELEELPGIGKAMARTIQELLETGELEYLKTLRAEVPSGLLELIRIPNVGPKTAMLLHRELGISSLEQLKKAIDEHRLAAMKGLGEKTEERIRQGILLVEASIGRTLLGEALPIAEAYMEHLRGSNGMMMSVAGSLRRGKDTVGDIDILVGSDDPAAIMDAFISYPLVDAVIASGSTKSSVRLKGGMQVDIRAVAPGSYGAAQQYFTGSKEHNVALRRIGVEKGLKLNEYGLFERDSGREVASATEEDVYRALGFPLIPPELREGSGEIEAALNGALPELINEDQVLGDFHVHTDWSDGANTIDEMVASAIAKGYEFVAITDHSQSLRIANGLTPERLNDQVRKVREADERADGRIRVLAGSEVDIKVDGSLDFPDDVLMDLDVVIGSVHSRFQMDKREMTARVVNAIESGMIDILGHPTGRLLGQRAPYEIDLPAVLDAAAMNGVCVEINSFPDRLDLKAEDCRTAKGLGVKVSIGTDSHGIEHMDFIRLGVITARRGWLEAKDVLNTYSAPEVLKTLRSRR